MTHNSDDEKMASKKAIKSPLLFTLAVQLLVVSPVLVVLNAFNPLWTSSFFWGALVYSVPNAYFTFYAFRYRGSQQGEQIARSFYTGEFGKLALVAAGFALVFKFVEPLHTLALLAGFAILIATQWFVAHQITARLKNEN